jgi:drug/metabolite transporter (DMT)-like permease
MVGGAGLIWGSIPVFLHAADGASVVKVFYRVVFAGVVLAGWMAATGGWAEVRDLPPRKLRQLIVQGVILTVNWVLFLTALDMTNVATAELLGYMGPVFVALLAPLVSKEGFDSRIVVPMLLALAGIAVILAPQGLAMAAGRQLIGAVLAFASALTYAWLLLRSKRILSGVTGRALMIVEYVTASILLLPFAIWFTARGEGPSSLTAFGALAVIGVVHTALAGVLFLAGLRRVRTDHAAVLTYTEPASAVVFAAAFMGQPLTWPTAVGGLMVVGGGALVARLEAPDVAIGPESASALGGETEQGGPRDGVDPSSSD